MRVNADGARNVSVAAAKVGAAVVYPSSDYVFDGSKDSPYVESDEPSPALELRHVEARRRGRHLGGEPAPLHRPQLVAVRRRRAQLRRDDARAGRRAGPGARGARPDRLPHLHRPPGRGPGAAHLDRGLRPAPHGGRGPLHLVRLRRGDLRPRGRGLQRDVRHHGRPRAPRAAAGVLGARHAVPRGDPPARLAGRPARLPRGARR